MSETILLQPPRNISFYVLGRPARWRCTACGGPDAGAELRCERCTACTHWDCYWDRVAGAAEYRQFYSGVEDDYESLVILCLGCRS